MKVECPSCAAAFDVPDWMLSGVGRPLKCGMCKTVFPSPVSAEPAQAPPPIQPPEAPPAAEASSLPVPPISVGLEDRPNPLVAREQGEDAVPAGAARFLKPAWAASIAALVLGGALFFAKKAAIMEAWPLAARFFSALGMT